MPPLLIAAGIAAAGSLGASALSSHAQKSAQKQAEQSPLALAQKSAIDQQSAYGKQAGDMSSALFPKYNQGVDFLSNYWKSVLGDSNSEALKSIAPLVQARKSQTQGQLRSLSFAPRGGGYGEAMSGIYDSQNRDILTALANERTNARSSYAGLIGDVGNRAQGLLGTAAGLSSNTASQLGQMNQTSLDQQNLAGRQSAATTTGLASALSPLIYQMIFNKGGGPNTPTPPVVIPPPPITDPLFKT